MSDELGTMRRYVTLRGGRWLTRTGTVMNRELSASCD